jgi:hypothetical protein
MEEIQYSEICHGKEMDFENLLKYFEESNIPYHLFSSEINISGGDCKSVDSMYSVYYGIYSRESITMKVKLTLEKSMRSINDDVSVQLIGKDIDKIKKILEEQKCWIVKK